MLVSIQLNGIINFLINDLFLIERMEFLLRTDVAVRVRPVLWAESLRSICARAPRPLTASALDRVPIAEAMAPGEIPSSSAPKFPVLPAAAEGAEATTTLESKRGGLQQMLASGTGRTCHRRLPTRLEA